LVFAAALLVSPAPVRRSIASTKLPRDASTLRTKAMYGSVERAELALANRS